MDLKKFGRHEGCPSTELARSHGISQSCIYEFVARHAGDPKSLVRADHEI